MPMRTPLVLVHGFGTDSRAWNGCKRAMDAPLRTVDLPGHGGGLAWGEPTLEPAVAEVLRSTSALTDGPVVGVGWSLGAKALICAAIRVPGAFKGLVLIGAAPCFVRKEGFPWGMSPALVRRMKLDMRKDAPGSLKRFLRLNFTAVELGLPGVKAFLDAYSEAGQGLAAFRYDEIAVALDALSRVDLRGDLFRLKAPTLVIHGSSDAICHVEAGRSLASGIEGAEFMVFEGAGHAPFVTQEARFIEAIGGFVERIKG
jgi:pimeloyl-[acyl-carrier protein] methyl ester esterase